MLSRNRSLYIIGGKDESLWSNSPTDSHRISEGFALIFARQLLIEWKNLNSSFRADFYFEHVNYAVNFTRSSSERLPVLCRQEFADIVD